MMKPQPASRDTMLQLGYLGLLPFIGGVLVTWADLTLFGLSGEQLFLSYSAVILSFLSGVLWGNGIDHFSHKLSRNALLLSNLFALLAWGALIQGATQYLVATGLLATGYLAVWLAEKWIRKSESEDTSSAYQTMRGRLTIAVVACHGLLLIVV
ncbi:DUF3429 domain-containing protein [Salinivibrio kushneri]|uniref:DUF3429 domain-containing protein n=1 Tax=Salinivibrio kushneri TaxID=1908198 RepID=UPI0022B2F975|nr:DUF3429 domain-containing protein [Salinivibrio kushneri]WBA10775.1 DUF3429 domain-containing protein [Salinivibrio kushneri]